MKNLNKKGFFMTETLVVVLFVVGIFTFLYVSVIPLIGTYTDKTIRESDIDIVYKLYSIRKALNKGVDKNERINMTGDPIKEITCDDFVDENYCDSLLTFLELKSGDTNNCQIVYMNNIVDNLNTLQSDPNYKEIYEYIKDYKDDEAEDGVLILLDKKEHTIAHLKYINSGLSAADILIKNAQKKTCNPIFTDTDGVKYFSGTNECIDFNYVWYSGKLWRITAVYPDGSMKLITQNNITSIAFNGSGQVNFWTDANTTSYMYQWLNEDFYDTLYNASEFIDTTKRWNATMPADTTRSTKPAETNMVSANVGLLNSYEYYNSYRCIGSAACTGSSYGKSYLYIDYFWCLLNPYSASRVDYVGVIDTVIDNTPTNAYGGRPSIYLKSGVEFTGSGTISSPYKIVGDKDTGRANDLINTRLSGEYVKLKNGNNEQTFRIIGVEDGKAKIIAMDYADNKATKKFATSQGTANTLWGSGTTTGEGTWYTYLNTPTTGYYAVLQSTYGDLFTSGTYYLGTSGYNYKLSVCANTTSGNTKVCDKATNQSFNIGLPRYGEMFATPQAGGTSSSIDMWLMNRYSTSYVWYVRNYGIGNGYGSNPANTRGGRPTVHLKSTVKILSGTGTESDPYVVGL